MKAFNEVRIFCKVPRDGRGAKGKHDDVAWNSSMERYDVQGGYHFFIINSPFLQDGEK